MADEQIERLLREVAQSFEKSAKEGGVRDPETLEEARDRIEELEHVLRLILAASDPSMARWIEERVSYDTAWDVSTAFGRAQALARIALGREKNEG
jgi:hypothetical protein